jgi:exosortase/archaeosortase family protein
MIVATESTAPWLPGWAKPLVRAILAAVIGSILFLLVADPIRQFEARAAAQLAAVISGDSYLATDHAAVLISPEKGPVFFGVVTRSCSMTVSLLCMGAVALVVVPRNRQYRWRALGAGLAVVSLANLVRVTGVLVAGNWLGQSGVAPVHDIVGTPMSLISGAVGIVAWWRVLESADLKTP